MLFKITPEPPIVIKFNTTIINNLNYNCDQKTLSFSTNKNRTIGRRGKRDVDKRKNENKLDFGDSVSQRSQKLNNT